MSGLPFLWVNWFNQNLNFFSKNRARIHQVTDRDRDRVLPDPCFPRRIELSYLGKGCPIGLGTGSRILRVCTALSIVRRIFAVSSALFGYFWVDLPDFQHFWTDFGNFGIYFKHFLTASISRFWVSGSGAK